MNGETRGPPRAAGRFLLTARRSPFSLSRRTRSWRSPATACARLADANGADPTRLSQKSQTPPTGSDGRCGIGLQRLAQQFVVDVAEVRGSLQITIVEVGKAGLVAVEAALDGSSGDKHWAGGAVVGA